MAELSEEAKNRIFDLITKEKALLPRHFRQDDEVIATGKEIASGVWVYDRTVSEDYRGLFAVYEELKDSGFLDPSSDSLEIIRPHAISFVIVDRYGEASVLIDRTKPNEIWRAGQPNPERISAEELPAFFALYFRVRLPTLQAARRGLYNVIRARALQLWAAERRSL